jgi:hypothetical protein
MQGAHQIASNDATFLSRVINGDGSWIHSYDSDEKQKSSQWKMKSKVKSMLIAFFDIKRIVHKEFILADQIVNYVYYYDMLRRLRGNV